MTLSNKKKPAVVAAPTHVQLNVVNRIVELVQSNGLAAGTVLTELSVARDLGVSRTPARAALNWLVAKGLLERRPGEGFLTRLPSQVFSGPTVDVPVADADRIFLAFARARNAGQLPSDISEADLMRRLDATRPTLRKVLARLAEVGIVSRRTGHGWHISPNDHDDDAQFESYRFRMVIEPKALLEPQFEPSEGWIEHMRKRHKEMMERKWVPSDAIDLFEMNAEFHEGLAIASGNRFIQMAIQQQNRLRRFVNYEWNHGRDRMVISCREHLEILEKVETGDRHVASALMHRHLEKASIAADAGA